MVSEVKAPLTSDIDTRCDKRLALLPGRFKSWERTSLRLEYVVGWASGPVWTFRRAGKFLVPVWNQNLIPQASNL